VAYNAVRQWPSAWILFTLIGLHRDMHLVMLSWRSNAHAAMTDPITRKIAVEETPIINGSQGKRRGCPPGFGMDFGVQYGSGAGAVKWRLAPGSTIDPGT
jgi:hypothetical protein